MGLIKNNLAGTIYKLRLGPRKELIASFVDVQLFKHAGNVITKAIVLTPHKSKPWWSKPTEETSFELNWFQKNSIKLGKNSCFYFDAFYSHNWEFEWKDEDGFIATNCKSCGFNLYKQKYNRFDETEFLSCDSVIVKDIIT